MKTEMALEQLQQKIEKTFLKADYQGVTYETEIDKSNSNRGSIRVQKNDGFIKVPYCLNTGNITVPNQELVILLMSDSEIEK